MRYLIFMLLSPLIGFSQVNFSTYGATDNGASDDDTAELQAALDAEDSLIADAGATFYISSTLDIDTRASQTIDWNGATIVTNTLYLTPFIEIDKRSVGSATATIMDDLLIDANDKGTMGVWVYSKVTLTNIDGQDYVGANINAPSPAHLRVEFFNDDDNYGNWLFDGCDVNGLQGWIPGSGTNAIGAANGYLIYWRDYPNSLTTITFQNATVQNGYGTDGQNIGIFSPGKSMGYTNGELEFKNITTSGWERRSVKAFCGNLLFENCTFNADLDSNKTDVWVSAGFIAIGANSGATGASNIIFEGCEFVGQVSGTRDNRIIPFSGVTDLYFRNCTFSGSADLAFSTTVGDVEICGSTFGAGSFASDYNESSDIGQLTFDTDNVYTEANFFSSLNFFSYIETDLTCVPLTGGGAVVDIFWNVTNETINIGQSVDYGHTFDPTDPTDIGFSLASADTGVLSNAGIALTAGTSINYTITADDTTNSASAIKTVTVNAADTDAPVIQTIEVTELTDTTFKVSWTLDEGSKAWIIYGVSSDLSAPFVYDQDTTHENTTTLLTHVQTVGGNTEDDTDPLLLNGTKYYYRIYMEDAVGNIGYSDEYTTTTLGGSGTAISGFNYSANLSPYIYMNGVKKRVKN